MHTLKVAPVCLAALLATLLVGLGATPASAESAPVGLTAAAVNDTAEGVIEDVNVAACGFWENAATAFYSHCASNCIWIIVDYNIGSNKYKMIPGRGTYDIGGARSVVNAWYSHVC